MIQVSQSLLLFWIFLVISVYYYYNSLFIEFLNYQVYEVPLVFCPSLPMSVCTYVLFAFSVYMLHVPPCVSFYVPPASLVYSCMIATARFAQCPLTYVSVSLFWPPPLSFQSILFMCVPPSQPCVLPHVEFVS